MGLIHLRVRTQVEAPRLKHRGVRKVRVHRMERTETAISVKRLGAGFVPAQNVFQNLHARYGIRTSFSMCFFENLSISLYDP
jgi:hypothetical protein